MKIGRRAVSGGILAGVLGGRGVSAQGVSAQGVPAQGVDDALVRAAKAEGSLIFYSATTEAVARRVGEAFERKYGIKVQALRINSAGLMQRYASEAQTGNIAADIGLTAGDVAAFGAEAVRNGWVVDYAQAGVPAVESGRFPARFLRGAFAIVQIQSYMFAYNTDRVKGSVPRDWLELLDTRFRGEWIIADPVTSDAYSAFWLAMLDAYGESFFERLRALAPRRFREGVPATQALAAGEGSFQVPVIPSQVTEVQKKGAPVELVRPEFTTGVEFPLFLTAPGKAKHPNAARLFADYLMSVEGNAVLNDEPGTAGVYDASRLPAKYVSPKQGLALRREEVRKLLGYVS